MATPMSERRCATGLPVRVWMSSSIRSEAPLCRATLHSLKARGTIVNLGLSGGSEAKISHLYPFFRNERRIVGAWMGSMAELEFGLDLVKQGKVRPVLHKTLPLKQVREAHRMIASHEVMGKLALLPWAA